jgi:hypothetical protein
MPENEKVEPSKYRKKTWNKEKHATNGKCTVPALLHIPFNHHQAIINPKGLTSLNVAENHKAMILRFLRQTN